MDAQAHPMDAPAQTADASVQAVTERLTLVFDTSTHALWAEEVAQAHGIAAEVVPAPAESDAKCDLALVCRVTDGPRLQTALQTEGVEYRTFSG